MPSRTRILVAPVTPMSLTGDLHLANIPPLCKLLLSRGADGFYLCGGTGEGMLLETAERIQVVEAWRAAAGGDVPIFVHVGAASIAEAQKLAEHAAGIGAAAISSVAPPVYTAADLNQLIASFIPIAKSAPDTPFYFYHNSSSPGPKVSGYDFLAAAEQAIPTLAGIKFTHEDLLDLSRCLRFQNSRFRIFYGKDEFLLGALAMGATRFIGGSFNLLMPLVKTVLDAFDAGNIKAAQTAQHRIVDVIVVLRRFGGLAAVKAAMSLLGVPCGGVRLPLRTLTLAQQDELFTQLRHAWPEVTRTVEVSVKKHLSPVSVRT